MIKIEERTPNKLPGLSSLFISFNYRPEIVDVIKSLSSCIYDKNSKTWEAPVTHLASLLDRLSIYDEIELFLLEDGIKKDDIAYELQNYKTTPFEYQKQGIQFGLNHNSWLLLDAPGLGKSLQIIYLAQELKEKRGLEHCFIICGVNTLKHNWKKEIQKHSDLSCKILGETFSKTGKAKIGTVQERINELKAPIEEFFIITNIETLRNNEIIKQINNGINKFDMLVVDEIHTCKSPTSQQGKNLLKLTKATYKIGTTGTLLLNSPLDTYVPLKWIGADHSTYTNFKYYYCIYDGLFNNILSGYKNIDVLKNQLEQYSLRRPKSLLNLPPKNIIHEFVDLDTSQAIFYENIKNGVKEEANKVELHTGNLLSLVIRLRQAVVCPSILTTEQINSAKIERAIDLSEQIIGNGEKVVIFSTFKETLNELEKKLEEFSPVLCTGDIKDDIIIKNIDAFQNDDNVKVMLATWQKMGTGITLTAASYAIFLDCAWTAAQNQQAEDRIYRIGAENPVFIYYLWANNTIDIRVKEIIEDKALLSDYIIDGNCPPALTEKLKEIILEL